MPRLNLPELDWGTNCVRSVQAGCLEGRCPTLFPAPVALGAAFNDDIVHKMAQTIAGELRALYVGGVGEHHPSGLPHVGLSCWSPTINIARDPRWGRNFESPSEDPTHASHYAANYVRGLQEGEDPRYLKAAATLKHFSVYNVEGKASNHTRHSLDAVTTKRDLQETYWPAFKAAIQLGNAKGIMCSYNAVNGVPSCANPEMQNLLLRKRWGFSGYITGDSGAVEDIYTAKDAARPGHGFTETPEAGVAAALNAGTDMASSLKLGDHATGSPYTWFGADAVSLGLVQPAIIDQAVSRTLRLRFQLGLMDPVADQPYFNVTAANVSSDAARALNARAALEGLVLLKNGPAGATGLGPDSVLPFARGLKLAVIGPHGNATAALLHGYAGQVCPGGFADYSCLTTPFEALRAANAEGGGETTLAPGSAVTGNDTAGYAAAAQAAAEADAVVLCVGLDRTVEDESRDRPRLGLPDVQKGLVDRVLAAGKPTAVVLFNGGALAVDALVDAPGVAILEAWYPSVAGSAAVAAVLFGDASPSGKLPVTVYPEAYADEAAALEDMSMTAAPGRTYKYYTGTPLYPFGFGLSYTTFDIKLRPPPPQDGPPELFVGGRDGNYTDDVAQIAFDIFNTGNRTGAETMLCYFKPGAGLTPPGETVVPRKVLLAYMKMGFNVSGSGTIGFNVPARYFSTVDAGGEEWVVPGNHSLVVTNGNDQTIEQFYAIKTPDMQPVKVAPFDLAPSPGPTPPGVNAGGRIGDRPTAVVLRQWAGARDEDS